jgi:acyl-CoA synthetase (AMP-forming)/AMP-acid ligase II
MPPAGDNHEAIRTACRRRFADGSGWLVPSQDHVKSQLAAPAYPRNVHFTEALPPTATGTVMRGELRRRLTEERG